MPVTVAAAALAALLAAEPEPPPAEWGTGAEEPAAPRPPPKPPDLPPMPHSIYHPQLQPPPPDFTLAAGWGTGALMGLAATGVEVTFEAALPLAAPSRALPLVAADVFVGETSAGLAIRSFALGAEVWWNGSRVRAGGGLGAALVGYRRATNGEWDLLAAAGLRAGVEVAVLRLGRSDVVLGAHGTASLGPWVTGSFTLGWRVRAR